MARSMFAPASRARRLGLAHSLLGALCSAIYLFPYKRAGSLSSPEVVAYALLIVAAVSTTALYLGQQNLWQQHLPQQHLPQQSLWHASARPTLDRRTFWLTSLLLSLLTISGNVCGAQAVTRLEPAVTSVLLRTEIVFVGVFAALVVHERLTVPVVAGAAVALAGVLVMRWPLRFDGAGAGASWALGAAASFGMMQVLTRRVIGRISPIAVNACRLWLAVGALTLMPGLVRSAFGESGEFWWFVTLAGLFGPFLGRLFIMYSLRELRAAHSALLLLLAPVLAFGIGFITEGSVPSGVELGGGLIILAGVALPSLAGLRERAANA